MLNTIEGTASQELSEINVLDWPINKSRNCFADQRNLTIDKILRDASCPRRIITGVGSAFVYVIGRKRTRSH